MSVSYDGNKIIPVETFDIKRSTERSEAGVKQRSVFQLLMKGTLVAWKGSPTSSGTFWTSTGYPPDEDIAADSRLAAILTKQGALSNLFCQDGRWLEIQSADGSPPLKAQVRNNDVVFAPGQWFEKCEFTISSECDVLYFGSTRVDCGNSSLGPDGKPLVDSETWSLDGDDVGRVYKLTHNVSARRNGELDPAGIATASGWTFARDAVIAHLGFNESMLFASGVLNLANYQAYDHGRSQTVDENDNTFSVTEWWNCFNPGDDIPGSTIPAIDEYTCEVRTNSQEGVASVSLQGNIRGLHQRDPSTFAITSHRWVAAQAKWAEVSPLLYARAVSLGGVGIYPTVVNAVVSINRFQGTISYNYEYSSRPTSDITGAISVTTSVTNDYQADLYASFPVPFRLAGPVMQDPQARTAASRTISVEVIMSPSSSPPIVPVAAIIASWRPSASQVYIERDTDNWVVENGRYNRQTTFVYGN